MELASELSITVSHGGCYSFIEGPVYICLSQGRSCRKNGRALLHLKSRTISLRDLNNKALYALDPVGDFGSSRVAGDNILLA